MDETFTEKVAPALGKIASGLYVLTGMLPGGPIGMLASFIEQTSFSPPMLSVSLGKDRPLRKVLETHGMFGIHILGKENTSLMKRFARPDAEDAFAQLSLTENPYGIPQLSDAMAFLACKAVNSMDAGDHLLFLAEILDGRLQQLDQEPMIRIRRNGFSY